MTIVMYILLWIVTFVIFRPSDVQSEWGLSIYLLSNTFIRINTVAVGIELLVNYC